LYKKKEKNNIAVGVGLYVWNGEKTIDQTLSSLIKQTYKAIKIYVLDNRSTDKTADIVKKFIKKDKRIKLIIDKKRRDQASAPRFLLNKFLKNFKYSVIVSDDDIYHKKFIELTVSKLKKNKLNMVYPSYNLIDVKNKIYKSKDFPIYSERSSMLLNLLKFVTYRNNAIMMNAGVFETKCSIKSYKYHKIYDSSLVNWDNLMLLHFFANYKIGYIKKKLINSRIKDRIETAKNRGQEGIFKFEKFTFFMFMIFVYQFNFSIVALKIIYGSNKINILKKIILNLIIIFLYFQKCTSYIFKKFYKKSDIYKNRTS
jgi:glycosyltransferase involved in cell wall biosynthesis